MRRGSPWPLGAALLAACASPSGAPEITSVVPSTGTVGTAIPIVIHGRGFAALRVDLDSGEARTDPELSAKLGPYPLSGLQLISGTELMATVPAAIEPSRYDLELWTRNGASAVLPEAYEAVLSPESAAALRITSRASVVAGVVLAVELEAVDEGGRRVTTYEGTVLLSDTAGFLAPRQVGPFARGRASARVTIEAVGSDTLVAVDEARQELHGSSQPFEVVAGPATALRFTAAPPLVAGNCSGAIELVLHDARGFVAAADGDELVALSASPHQGVRIFADEGCTVATTELTLPSGTSGASVYVLATHAGPAVLRAAPARVIRATLTVSVQAASAANIAFTTPTRVTALSSCSGPIALGLVDAYGNPASGIVTVSLRADARLGLFADSACTIPTNELALVPTGELHVRGEVAGAVRIFASSALGNAAQIARIEP